MDKRVSAVKEVIVDSKDSAKWIELCDAYIELYNRNPKLFLLPTNHELLEPVIKEYHDDLVGFLRFVRDVRDLVDMPIKQQVHTLYRRLTSRAGQKIRRARLNTAIQLIEEELQTSFTKEQKDSIGMWLTQYWGKERVDMLDEHRAEFSNNRIPTQLRTELCEQFWDDVDKNLENNIVPIPPEVVYGKHASLESYKPDNI